MAAKKRGGGGKKGGGKGGIIGIITSVISVIIIGAIVIGFLRSNNMTDAQSVINASRESVNPTQSFAGKIYNKFNELLSCNIIKNSNCIKKPSGELKDPGDAPAPSHGNPENILPDDNSSKTGTIGGDKTGTIGGNASNNDNTANNQTNETSTPSDLENKLNQITIADGAKTNYNRADYPHWIIQNGKCDTRETVLANAGFASNAKTCKAEAKDGFTYTEPYSGKKVSDPSKLDIDHVIPLGYADAHGGHEWDTSKKQQFANDTSQLLAVDASANRKKGDKGPSEWMPSNKDYTCEYSTIWINTALKYGVSITDADKNALKTGIQSCK